jgi:hypothetical protein
MLNKEPKLSLREKKTRCISIWIPESDYLRLLEMAADNSSIANIGRQAVTHYLKSLRKKGRS